ncbi:MAG: hypothetical protein ABSA46_11355 [Thermodesulfovibrionales bacterium]|jgi:hypothetical protein
MVFGHTESSFSELLKQRNVMLNNQRRRISILLGRMPQGGVGCPGFSHIGKAVETLAGILAGQPPSQRLRNPRKKEVSQVRYLLI